MLVWRADVFPVECVIRGYIAGSAWKEYRSAGTLAGEPLATGLRESDRLTPAIFSPATKAETGHDENIPMSEMRRQLGVGPAEALESMSRLVYSRGRDLAAARGIIIADTKFEFGLDAQGEIILIDEALTPDSSRFWPLDDYEPGRAQASFDKQFVRDYLETLDWDKRPPAPPLPAEVAAATTARYLEAYRLLTGSE
jgi:phosphoribosylaminoimidazole-succinocarboxamide synthase